MRTYVYCGTSLDGFIAKPDGNLDWLVKFQNSEIGESYEEFLRKIDVHVLGRGTYETVMGFPTWPYAKKAFVLSNTLKQLPPRLREKAEILSLKPKEVLVHLSREGFSGVYVDGGNVIQGFLREDCIDEMIVTKAPVLLGQGIPLFGPLTRDLHFQHKDTKVFSNGLVRSRYVRKRS